MATRRSWEPLRVRWLLAIVVGLEVARQRATEDHDVATLIVIAMVSFIREEPMFGHQRRMVEA